MTGERPGAASRLNRHWILRTLWWSRHPRRNVGPVSIPTSPPGRGASNRSASATDLRPMNNRPRIVLTPDKQGSNTATRQQRRARLTAAVSRRWVPRLFVLAAALVLLLCPCPGVCQDEPAAVSAPGSVSVTYPGSASRRASKLRPASRSRPRPSCSSSTARRSATCKRRAPTLRRRRAFDGRERQRPRGSRRFAKRWRRPLPLPRKTPWTSTPRPPCAR